MTIVSKPDEKNCNEKDYNYTVQCDVKRQLVYTSYCGKVVKDGMWRWTEDIKRIVAACPVSTVHVHVHSSGGDVHGSHAAVDYMRSLHNRYQVSTLGTGIIASAGYTLLTGMASSGRRYITPHTLIMLHPMTAYGGKYKVADTQALLDGSRILADYTKDIYVSGNTPVEIYNRYASEGMPDLNHFTAQQALDKKIVDKVVYNIPDD